MSRTTTTSSAQPVNGTASNYKPKIWQSLLQSVASTRQIADKQILVLGGSVETQRDFLTTLSEGSNTTTQNVPVTLRRQQDRNAAANKRVPVANLYALGYTYLDVLEGDTGAGLGQGQEDVLARMSVYMLAEPDPSYTELLRPLLTPKTIPDTALVLLLDWKDPWDWIRQLRDWIVLLRAVITSLSKDCHIALDSNITRWQNYRAPTTSGTAYAGQTPSESSDAPSSTLLDPVSAIQNAPGVWDEPLGMPLIVVAQNSDAIEAHEKKLSWKVDTFDYILQFLRTILVKHGASLIYTMSPTQTQGVGVSTATIGNNAILPTLVHSMLDIKSETSAPKTSGAPGSIVQGQIKHDVTNRDTILIPLNWDSWGKIRVQTTEDLAIEVEALSQMWSRDINQPLTTLSTTQSETISTFATRIRDPSTNSSTPSMSTAPPIDVTSEDIQSFLATQADILRKLQSEDDKAKAEREGKKTVPSSSMTIGTSGILTNAESGAVIDQANRRTEIEAQIGPVQFNVGGIQVDVEQTLQRLQAREADRATSKAEPIAGNAGPTRSTDLQTGPTSTSKAIPERPRTPPRESSRTRLERLEDSLASPPSTADDTEKLMQFFKGLKTRGGSAASSPNAKRSNS